MPKDYSYEAVMGRRPEIMKNSIGIDFEVFENPGIGFDYERMMKETGYTLEEMTKIQGQTGVGNTPLLEMKNLTKLAKNWHLLEREPGFLSKMKHPILPAASKPVGRQTLSIMRKNWAIKVSLQQPVGIMVRQLPVRQRCTD